MKKRAVIIIFSIFSILFLSIYFKISNNGKRELEFTNITKGDIKITVSCSGTIEPQKTVEVGTQVSGTISKIYVQNNSKIRKGQILAKLDSSLLEIAVKEAEATLIKTKSDYEYNKKIYQNNLLLNKEKLISDVELESSKVNLDSSYAQYLAAEASLLKAKTNLEYSVIRSPIDGIVLEKAVEEGQTVAASFSAPTLFTLAEDLSNIKIEALIPESDIGKVKNSQPVIFIVDAYPLDQFHGTVKEVYLNPIIESNVVYYKAIIEAKNFNNKLLPGMTATIEIVVEEKKETLTVKTSALKFLPDKDLLKQYNYKEESFTFNNKDNKNPRSKNNNDNKIGVVWYLDKNRLKSLQVSIGLSDGINTEIFSDKIKEGFIVISGVKTPSKKENNNLSKKTTSNNRMGPPPMF